MKIFECDLNVCIQHKISDVKLSVSYEGEQQYLLRYTQSFSHNNPRNFNTVLISIILCMRKKMNLAKKPLF